MSTEIRKYHPEEHSWISRKFRYWRIKMKLKRLGLSGDPSIARANLESLDVHRAIKKRVRRKLN